MAEPPVGFTGRWRLQEAVGGGHRDFALLDGVKHGPWQERLGDGRLRREGDYVEGLLHGEVITYGSSGQVLDRTTFVHGTGTWRIFTSDDQLGCEIPMVAGRKHGLVRRRCGGLWREQPWRDGQSIGDTD